MHFKLAVAIFEDRTNARNPVLLVSLAKSRLTTLLSSTVRSVRNRLPRRSIRQEVAFPCSVGAEVEINGLN
jgi:hypothetical protein